MHLIKLIFPLCIIILLSLLACSQQTDKEWGKQSNTDTSYPLQNSMAYPDWYNPSDIDTMTIVTWNVEHFVDQYNNPYIDNRREDNPPEDMEKRYQLLAKALRVINADVVVFEEFESDSFLKEYADNYLSDMNYHVFAALESPDWYMNVVMMSRVPMGMFYSYAHISTPIPGQVDDQGNPDSQSFINNRMWTADLVINEEYNLSITGAHLKAGRGERNAAWRTGQIALLREHLNRIMQNNPRRNIIVMGDLNSTPDSPEFRKLLGDGIPHLIDPLAGTKVYTHPSDSTFWRIDHILPNMQAGRELVPQSVEIARPLTKKQMTAISDHLPLKARIVTKDQ